MAETEEPVHRLNRIKKTGGEIPVASTDLSYPEYLLCLGYFIVGIFFKTTTLQPVKQPE